jgi:hypothetical protein
MALSMKSAILGLAKPASRAFSSAAGKGATGRACARGLRRFRSAYFGTTTAEALMQLRPPLSEMEETIKSMNSGQRSIWSSPMRILL